MYWYSNNFLYLTLSAPTKNSITMYLLASAILIFFSSISTIKSEIEFIFCHLDHHLVICKITSGVNDNFHMIIEKLQVFLIVTLLLCSELYNLVQALGREYPLWFKRSQQYITFLSPLRWEGHVVFSPIYFWSHWVRASPSYDSIRCLHILMEAWLSIRIIVDLFLPSP